MRSLFCPPLCALEITVCARTLCPKGIYTIGQLIAFFPLTFLPDTVGRRGTTLIGKTLLV